jgi:hypothetical protein
MDVRDIVERTVWTAIEAGLAVVVAANAGWTDLAVWQSAAIVGVAAGLAAFKNAVKQHRAAR